MPTTTRARRRFDELKADGQDVTLDAVCENLRRRDAIDAKQWESLLAPGAAIVIDTTGMSISAVIDHMLELLTENGQMKNTV